MKEIPLSFREAARKAYSEQTAQLNYEVLMFILRGYASKQITVLQLPDTFENGQIVLHAQVIANGPPLNAKAPT